MAQWSGRAVGDRLGSTVQAETTRIQELSLGRKASSASEREVLGENGPLFFMHRPMRR